MTTSATHPDDHPTAAEALATLGLVAALVCFLMERVLPRWRPRDWHEAATLMHLQSEMAALAAVAWRQVERPEGPDLSDAMAERAEAMRDALLALLACAMRGGVRRSPFRPVRPGRAGHAGGWASTSGAAPLAATASAALARDGPPP